MSTLTMGRSRLEEMGAQNEIPVVAADIIYQGAAAGVVKDSGHARPLSLGDKFGGFAISQCDNSLGAAEAKSVKVLSKGKIKLAVAGAVITDLGMPVYASDDDTFSFVPTGVFVGFVSRFVSSGVVIVDVDAIGHQDPFAAYSVREVKSANYTLDAEDSGKLICVDTDAITLTLPAIADGFGGATIVNIGAYGTIAVTISPNVNDMILGPDITGANDKDLINTKATAQRFDRVKLDVGDADGYVVHGMVGVWARQA